jgi:hypothetical protein
VPARLTRVLAGLGCLLVLVTPVLVTMSERSLRRADAAFEEGDCPRAIDAALSSAEALSVRPEPYELLGYCNLRLGATGLGVRAMATAHRREPRSWRYAYGLAVARGLDGQDPRPALAVARRLNPRAVAARDLESKLRGATPRAWRRAAARALLPD